jgi:hypothetical protein
MMISREPARGTGLLGLRLREAGEQQEMWDRSETPI